jgi:hypothetical protein
MYEKHELISVTALDDSVLIFCIHSSPENSADIRFNNGGERSAVGSKNLFVSLINYDLN